MTHVEHRLHLTLDDQCERRYYEVALELGGADSVEVYLDYDTSRAVIDLGCVQGAAVQGGGVRGSQVRGWSGGARSRFVITPSAATPGYLPGPLGEGCAVVLGLHKLPADGVDVVLTIDAPAVGAVEAEPARPAPKDVERASARALPAPGGLTWWAGDFHAHTYHSDGDQSPAQLAARAVERGLDFLAVTDHNTTSHWAELPGVAQMYSIALIPGQEVTTARGHANALGGTVPLVDFREPAERWVQVVEGAGGVLSVNHPLDGDCAWLHPLPVVPCALEFFHISWFRDLTATFPWAFLPLWQAAAGRAGAGRAVTLLGGSDFHTPSQGWPPGTPTTWVAAPECTPEALLEGVKAGRTAITRFPQDPALVRVDGDLVAVGAAGLVLVDIMGRRRILRSDREVLVADQASGPRAAGIAPYHLQDPDRMVIAVSP